MLTLVVSYTQNGVCMGVRIGKGLSPLTRHGLPHTRTDWVSAPQVVCVEPAGTNWLTDRECSAATRSSPRKLSDARACTLGQSLRLEIWRLTYPTATKSALQHRRVPRSRSRVPRQSR